MKLFFKCGWNWSLKQGRWGKGLFPWEGPHLLVSPWLQQELVGRGMAPGSVDPKQEASEGAAYPKGWREA